MKGPMHNSSDGLTKRESFLLMVYYGALCADLANGGQDAQSIARVATEIPSHRIPPNVPAAASVFLSFFRKNGEPPHDWMLLGPQPEDCGKIGGTAAPAMARALCRDQAL